MPTHTASRNRILKENHLTPRITGMEGKIKELEYAAVPPPINSQAQPAGNCLIWLGLLNRDGYGARTFTQGRDLAHREAFRESRGREPRNSVLHLCNRPYCIQPSHLYEGNAQDNSDDRRLLMSDSIESQITQTKFKQIAAASKYWWPDPAQTQVPMTGLPEPSDTHECNFIIPAGDVKLCQTCNKPETSTWDDQDAPAIGAANFQDPGNDGNSVNIQKTKTTVTEVAPGLSFVATGTTDINLATSRPEQRRRRRQEKKRDMRPRLLGVERTNFSTNEGHISLKSQGEFLGPGLLVVVATPIRKAKSQPSPSRQEIIAQQLLAATKGRMAPASSAGDSS